MENDQLIQNILNEYNFSDIEFDEETKNDIIYPAIELLKAKIDDNPDFNFNKILIIALVLFDEIRNFQIKLEPIILIQISTVIWHSTILRPGDKGYYKQEDLERMFDQSLTAVRFIREEMGITHKKYGSIEDFFKQLDESIPLREQSKVDIKEVQDQEYDKVRKIITKKIIGRGRAQSAIECSAFLYFNEDKAYSKNEIYYIVDEDLDLPGLTPRRSFNSDISRYTENSQAQNKRSPQLFTIVDINEKQHRIQLIPEIRAKIDELIGNHKPRYWIFQSNHEKFDIEKAIKELERDVFTVNQYKNEIKKGDKVLFWVSGTDAGIIGHGEVLTDPEITDQNPEAVKFIKDNDLIEKSLRVWVSYNEIKPRILKVDLQEDYLDITEKMSIIKNARGTNFLIDKEIWDFFKKKFIDIPYYEIPTIFNPGLTKGQVIKNPELMEIFKVSNSGGMRRSHRTNSLVLISDHTKGLYQDRWEGEILHYTGMGLTGDQSLEFKQNKTLNESNLIDINLFLFEVLEPREYTFKGKIKLADAPYQEEQTDSNGKLRKVWIFPLKLIEENPITFWTCPMSSCGNEEIDITRNEKNLINTPTYEKIIVHFLKHLKRNNIYFGGTDIYKIFIENSPTDILSDDDKGLYPDYGTGHEPLIWQVTIRTALGTLTKKKFIETVEKEKIENFYNLDLDDKRKYRTRKRTNKFFEEFKNSIYNDWELYQIPQEKEEIPRDSRSSIYDFPQRKLLSTELINPEELTKVKNLLLNSKQIILYGPPGTGKTYLAQILAQDIARDKYKIIQFHPSYSYEDFVEWIEAIPSDDGSSVIFKPKPRIFRELCEFASKTLDDNIVLIIDEINRGDLSRIFGELILCLEPSNRNLEISTPLSSSLGSLKIPNNLYIIGTMNSVDRSIAIVDYALRRRFLFYLLMPNYEMLENWLKRPELNVSDNLKKKILNLFTNLNKKIVEDRKLSKHHQIGHTFFFVNTEEELITRWEYMIKPLLEEYFNFSEEDLSDYDFNKLIQG